MQLIVHIGLDRPLVLPLNYNHILQSIIYRQLGICRIMQTFYIMRDTQETSGSTGCFNLASCPENIRYRIGRSYSGHMCHSRYGLRNRY